MLLDIRKLYKSGVTSDLFRPIEVPVPAEADFEIAFCEDILKSVPGRAHFETMVLLGDAYTRKGEYAKGLEMDIQLSRLQPENKLVRYNLACSYALTGQKEKAFSTLNKAVELGYRDVEHLRNDHDLDAIKSDPRFQSLLTKLSSVTQEPETSSHQGIS